MCNLLRTLLRIEDRCINRDVIKAMSMNEVEVPSGVPYQPIAALTLALLNDLKRTVYTDEPNHKLL